MKYGVDVASVRFDDLDREVFTYLDAHPQTDVLEIGAGHGALARALAQKGATVTAVDIGTTHQKVLRAVPDVTTVQAAAVDYISRICADVFDIAVVQRTLHYLSYEDAQIVLAELAKHTHSQLFISVTGTDTAIAEHHPKQLLPCAERFSKLSEVGQETFSITVPLCPYTSIEFNTLLKTTGWDVIRTWTSAFGNHKAICKPFV